jgi:hypothetical protein
MACSMITWAQKLTKTVAMIKILASLNEIEMQTWFQSNQIAYQAKLEI